MERANFHFPKWAKSEFFLVNFGLIIIILILFLWLYLEFHFSIGKIGEPIGKITYRVNESQRKYSSNFLWTDLDLNSNIYNYDTVRTDTSSRIYVMLNDKTEIQLEEDSMVVFDLSKDTLDLSFFTGKIRLDSTNVDKSKKIKIISGDSVVNLNNGAVQLKKLASSSVNVNVLEGKAELKQNNTTQSLEKGEEVKIRGEKLQKEKKKIRLLSPINSRYFLTRKSLDIEFEWEGDNTDNSYILEVYNSNIKSTPLIAKKINGIHYSQTLSPGKYIWKVYDSKKENSESDSFYVANDNPVKLFTPLPETFFNYIDTPPRILFSWSKNEFIRYYKLEISETNTFDKIKYQLTTENESSIVDNLDPGKYFYRVVTKTEFPDSLNKASQVNSFTISKKDTPNQNPKPEERNSTISNEEAIPLNLITPKDQASLDTDRLQFTWDKVKDNVEYLLEFSKSPEFTDIILSRKSKANSLLVTLPENGNFFWRVKATLQNGNSIISNRFSFSYQFNPIVQIVFPVNNSEVDVLSMDKFIFKWNKMEGAIYYSFELKRLATNENIIRESRLKTNEYILDDFTLLKTGEYECTVTARVLAKNSEEITTKPKTHKFKIFLSKKADKKDIKFVTPDNVYIER
jgi:type II secretory pathway component PulC